MIYLRNVLIAANKKGAGIKSFAKRNNGKIVLYYAKVDSIPEFYGSSYECFLYIVHAYNLRNLHMEFENTVSAKLTKKYTRPTFNLEDFYKEVDICMRGKFETYDFSMKARERILDLCSRIKLKYNLTEYFMDTLKDKLVLKYETLINESSSNVQFILGKYVKYFEKLKCG